MVNESFALIDSTSFFSCVLSPRLLFLVGIFLFRTLVRFFVIYHCHVFLFNLTCLCFFIRAFSIIISRLLFLLISIFLCHSFLFVFFSFLFVYVASIFLCRSFSCKSRPLNRLSFNNSST